MQKIDWENLTPLERMDIQIRQVIDSWVGPLCIEKTWEDNLHVVDILGKHIFSQLLEKKGGVGCKRLRR